MLNRTLVVTLKYDAVHVGPGFTKTLCYYRKIFCMLLGCLITLTITLNRGSSCSDGHCESVIFIYVPVEVDPIVVALAFMLLNVHGGGMTY